MEREWKNMLKYIGKTSWCSWRYHALEHFGHASLLINLIITVQKLGFAAYFLSKYKWKDYERTMPRKWKQHEVRNVTGKMNVTWTDLLCASLKCFVWIYCSQTPAPTNSLHNSIVGLHNSIVGAFCFRWVVSDIFGPTWKCIESNCFLRFLDVREGFVRCFLRCFDFFLSHSTSAKMPSENLWGFPVRCWFFRDCFSFCLGCFDCWLVTLFLSVSLGWSFEIYVLCHTLRFCFYF